MDGAERERELEILLSARGEGCREAADEGLRETPRLAFQNVLDGRERAGIVLLSEPEDRFLANRCAAMRIGQLDEHGNSLIVRKLRDGKDRMGAHILLRILVDRVAQRR